MACNIFMTRLLGRQHNHHHHKNKHLRHFLNCPSGSPTLKPSASIRLSMKDMVSNESQSAYVMCRPQQSAISPSLTRYLLQQSPKEQLKSSCPVAETETSFTYQQQSGLAVRMKSSGIKDYSIDSNRQDEDEEAMKLVVVRLIFDSVTNANEESTSFRQTSFIEDTSNDNQLSHHHPDVPIPSHPPIILPPVNPAQSKFRDRSADIGGDEDQSNEHNVMEADNIIKISFITASVDC
jgi:hypothetical protein